MDSIKNETEVKSEISEMDKLDENLVIVGNLIKDRDNIQDEKIEEEKKFIKELIDQISSSINEASSISKKALELVQQFSVCLEEKDSTGHHFSQISTPLKHAVESFGLSLKAIKFVGKALYKKNLILKYIITIYILFIRIRNICNISLALFFWWEFSG